MNTYTRALPAARRLAALKLLRLPITIINTKRVRSTATTSESTRTVLKLAELPTLNPPPPPKTNNEEEVGLTTFGDRKVQLPPVMKTVRELMDRHKGYVLLTQMGSFYELYFEQASEFADKLNLKITQKDFKDFAVPFAGFPLAQLEKYLRVLVQDLHQGVAIVEQYQRDSEFDNDTGLLPRRVARIVTPGTLIDEAFLNEQENNFLLSIRFPEKLFQREPDLDAKIGLSWMDLSVGSLFVQEVRLEDLVSTVTRVKPAEILVGDEGFAKVVDKGLWYIEFTEFQKYFINYIRLPSRHKTIEEFYYMFDYSRTDIKKTFGELSTWEVAALRTVLHYVEEHLPETTVSLQLPEKQYPENLVFIDSRTSEALELHVSLRNRRVIGSLFASIRRTVTAGGSRLLGQWLSAPSRDLRELKKRQRMVTVFVKNTVFRDKVVQKLKQIHDVSRILQRFALGKGWHFDLVRLAHSIQRTDELEQIIKEQSELNVESRRALKTLVIRSNSQRALADEILDDLDEDAIIADIKSQEEEREEEIHPQIVERRKRKDEGDLSNQGPIFVVKEQASPKLKRLHSKLRKLYDEKAELEGKLHELLISQAEFLEVQLKTTQSGDYQVYLRGGKKSKHDMLRDLLPESYEVNRSKSTIWLIVPEWKRIGESINSAIYRIQQEEQAVLKTLRRKVLDSSLALRQSAQNTEYIDVISSFSVLAIEKDLVCPELDKSTTLDITRGRHIVAEEGLKKDLKHFVPNDCHLTEEKKRWVITGPNMGGKSTFLRQNAIIVILAQMGCFVPADYARIGLVDKIFSRVGFNDDLINQLSTFMVEMLEVSYILHGATERSLAILDEVGRGTSGREGVAIAFSTLCHLNDVNNCRALFATHFGKEVAVLLQKAGLHDKFSYKKTTLSESDGTMTISHQLEEGITDRSYAINVAKAAGYPPLALERAKDAFDYLTTKNIL